MRVCVASAGVCRHQRRELLQHGGGARAHRAHGAPAGAVQRAGLHHPARRALLGALPTDVHAPQAGGGGVEAAAAGDSTVRRSPTLCVVF